MLVLVPPSEGKSIGGRGRWKPGSGRFGRALRTARIEVAAELVAAIGDEAGAARLLGVTGDALAVAVAADRALLDGPPVLAARERYSGVVWSHLDADSLGPDASAWLDDHVAVVSGLHGLVGAGDPTPHYRLKMSSRLGDLGPLSRYWRPRLDRLVEGRTVIDLLPQEHAAAVPPRGHDWVTVQFSQADGKPAGHFGKAAKGLFLRALVESRPATSAGVVEVARTHRTTSVTVEPRAHGVAVGIEI
ncbi:MAG: peroxide stress protein YaaA [Acidimicrobiia bacterium]|nr:peroxide stress protein YaaA [Acidimicrobiia bacterium]